MRLTFNRKLLFSAYIQVGIYGTLIFGSILLFLTMGLSPLGGADFVDQAGACLSAVIIGAGLYGTMKRWVKLTIALGTSLVVICLSSYAYDLELISSIPSTFYLYPVLALFFLCGGVCFLIGPWTRFGVRVWYAMAVVWTAVAFMLIIAHWWFPASFYLGNNAAATTMSSGFMMLFAPGFFLLPELQKEGFHRFTGSALYYSVGTLVLFCLAWYVLNFFYYQSIELSSKNVMDNFEQRIDQTFKSHHLTLSRLGRSRTGDTAEIRPETLRRLKAEAELIIDESPSFDAIVLVDDGSPVRKVLGKHKSSVLKEDVWTIGDEPFTEMAPFEIAALVTDSESGINYLVLKAYFNELNEGLVGIVRFEDLLENEMYLDTSPFGVHISINGSEVHYPVNPEAHVHSDLRLAKTTTLFGGASVKLEVIHSDPRAEAFLPNFFILLVVIGMVVSVIIASSIELAHTNQVRALEMARNATRQEKLRRIQAMIANHGELPDTLAAICDLLDSVLSGYHSSLWRTNEASTSIHFVASSQLPCKIADLSSQAHNLDDPDMEPASFAGSDSQPTDGFNVYETGVSDAIKENGYSHCYVIPVQGSTGTLIGAIKFHLVASENTAGESLQNEQGFKLINEIIPLIAMAIERHQDRKTLMYASEHDSLTGLPNRSVLESRLSAWYKGSGNRTLAASVMFIDLDGFKPINDGLGHATGDRVLVDVAARLTAHFRPEDLVVRFGGDEFVVLIPGVDDQVSTEELVWGALAALSEPYFIDDLEMSVTASIGISYCSDRNTLDGPFTLIQQADIAMYDAKRKGKNNAQWYSETFKTDVRSQVTLRNDLQRALSHDEFELHYQPVISIEGNISGFEALLRWNHPEHGRVSPDEFIPLAEETGQIIPLSEWVLDRACRDTRQLRFNESVRVAVNIAPLHFYRSDFIPGLNRILEHNNLTPEAMVLELTERTLMDEHGTMVKALQVLRKAGFRLSIDDFGTGYSSLSFIKHLPVNTVKIDKSFVTNITDSEVDAGMARAVVDMAHHLGLSVVAEGVETRDQLEKLISWGCDSMQGYYLCRPANLEDTLAFVAAWKGFGDNVQRVSKSAEAVSQGTSD